MLGTCALKLFVLAEISSNFLVHNYLRSADKTRVLDFGAQIAIRTARGVFIIIGDH